MDPVGLSGDVQTLLRPQYGQGRTDRKTRRPFRGAGHRRTRRRLHAGDAFHGRRMEIQNRRGTRTDPPELPPGVPRRHDGQLVSAAGHGTGQRRGEGRTLRTRRLSRRTEADETVAAPRNGLRPADARRTGAARVERLAEGDPAQLDRPFGRRPGLLRHPGLRPKTRDIHHASRHDLRRYLHGHRSGARMGSRPYHARTTGRRRGVHRPGEETLRAGAHRRNQARKRCSDRLLCDQPFHGQGDSDLHFGLRAGWLRHGGDHGCSCP